MIDDDDPREDVRCGTCGARSGGRPFCMRCEPPLPAGSCGWCGSPPGQAHGTGCEQDPDHPTPVVCPCHANVDVDGLPCARWDTEVEPCSVLPRLDGTLYCTSCDWRGTW